MIPESARKYIYHEEPGIVLLHGDCLEILPLLEPGSVDLVVTSPPYDDLREYGNNYHTGSIHLIDVIKNGGIVVWIQGDKTENGSETLSSFKTALAFREQGFNLHDTMIYQKDSCPFPETNRYYPSFEYMFIFSKGKPITVNLIEDKINKRHGELVASSTQRMSDGNTMPVSAKKKDPSRIVKQYGIRTNVWLYSPGYMKSTSHKIAYQHPAIFPDSLAKDHIISWSNPGDLILDPFLGSGTTAVVAKNLGRKCIGIEIHEPYLKIAVDRLRQGVLI